MIYLITYDICDPARLRAAHKFLKNYGLNTQRSVFECDIDKQTADDIAQHFLDILDFEVDALRIYSLCENCCFKTMISGKGVRQVTITHQVL